MDDHALRAGKFLALLSEQKDRLSRKKKKRNWLNALVAAISAACLLVITGMAYFSLDAKIKTVGSTANQVGLLKQQMTALDHREQLAVLGARIEQLSVAKVGLEADVARLTEEIETLKAGQKKISLARKR